MKIKAKLVLGIGLLFLMIVLLTLMSSRYINKLSGATKNILIANYNTLDYSRQMLIALNNGISTPGQLALFRENLIKQQHNVTEVGEKELTQKLTGDFWQLNISLNDSTRIKIIRTDISDIMLLNMQAIQHKSAIAEHTAKQSVLGVSTVGTICFLIAFVLLVNLPGNIANPIRELTDSIKEIASQNYSQRVSFEKHNEFGELASAFNTMAQRLEEYKAGNVERLMMEKKRIETLINNMKDPVIGLDDQKQIIFMNNTALKIAGLKSENVIGEKAQEVAVNNDLIRFLLPDLYNSTVAQSSDKRLPIKVRIDGKECYFEKEIIPIKIVPAGEEIERSVGNVVLLQNITPYKEMDSAKTNFIATVSHELKTPISSIKMSLQLLGNKKVGELNEEQHNLVGSIEDDADRLLKITGELLKMTQIESGAIQLTVVPSDPKDIVDYAMNANRIAAEQKQIKFEVSIPEVLPKVLADNEKTAWVITNLISNAIRYSDDHSTIFLGIAEDHEEIKFSVTDTGQGIAPQYLNKIFDRYFRIPGTKKEGTGLGLFISKEFIEAQGGNILGHSDLGSGSTFVVSLPAEIS